MSGAERMIGKSATKAGAWKTPIEHYTAGGVDEMGSLAGST